MFPSSPRFCSVFFFLPFLASFFLPFFFQVLRKVSSVHIWLLYYLLFWQEFCSGLSFPPLGDLPNPPFLHLLHCMWILNPLSHWGSPCWTCAKAWHTVLLWLHPHPWLHPLYWVQCLPLSSLTVLFWQHTHTSIFMKKVGREILFQTCIPESVLFCSHT